MLEVGGGVGWSRIWKGFSFWQGLSLVGLSGLVEKDFFVTVVNGPTSDSLVVSPDRYSFVEGDELEWYEIGGVAEKIDGVEVIHLCRGPLCLFIPTGGFGWLVGVYGWWGLGGCLPYLGHWLGTWPISLHLVHRRGHRSGFTSTVYISRRVKVRGRARVPWCSSPFFGRVASLGIRIATALFWNISGSSGSSWRMFIFGTSP